MIIIKLYLKSPGKPGTEFYIRENNLEAFKLSLARDFPHVSLAVGAKIPVRNFQEVLATLEK